MTQSGGFYERRQMPEMQFQNGIQKTDGDHLFKQQRILRNHLQGLGNQIHQGRGPLPMHVLRLP